MDIQPTFNWQVYQDAGETPPSVIDYLTESRHGSIFQSPPWTMATHPHPDRCIVAAAFHGHQPVFAALVEKSRLPGTGYFYGYIHRGPVFDDVDLAVGLWPKFEEIIRNEGICAATVQPFWEYRPVTPLIRHLMSEGYFISTKSRAHSQTLTIDLHRSIEEIFRDSLSSMRRGRIRKANKLGMTVRPAADEMEMATFWNMYHTMCQRKGIRSWPLERFKAVFNYSRRHPGLCTCLIAWLDGEIVGGIIVLRHGKTAEFTKGGSTSKKLPGVPKTELLHWQAIQWAKETGAAVYDFGGYTPNASKGSQEWGINKFKEGFTKRRVRLFEPMEKIYSPIPFQIFDSLREAKKRLSTIIPAVQRAF